jgi:hypothetical protein
MKIANVLVLVFLIVGAAFCSVQLIAGEDTLSALSAWKDGHQKAEDSQNLRIDRIESAVTANATRNSERLVALETKMTYLQASMGSLSTRLWALLTGTLALLANAIWGSIRQRLLGSKSKPPGR